MTPADSFKSEFLFLPEVAAILRAPLSSVRYWVATRRLKSVRPARRRLVRRKDLEEFLNAGPAVGEREASERRG
ncbi:MAG: helix-turn-helix domain-containing protein [Deltaproteobacteria bacterium]|nr:helix-turn-helix domain-containing protein [Deltaproteobacteria bacterium]